MVLDGLDAADAGRAMRAALATPFQVSGAAHLPGAGTLLRLEGFAGSVGYRAGALAAALAGFGAARVEEGPGAWAEIRDAARFAGREGAVWRVSVKPSDGPALGARLGGLRDRLRLGGRAPLGAGAGGARPARRHGRRRRARDARPGERRGQGGAGGCSTPSRRRWRRWRRACGRGSTRGACSTPGGWRPEMQTSFTPRAAPRPGDGAVEQDPPDLRALRLLHRDLPDLPGAGRRARQPARAHLPDQGHAGSRGGRRTRRRSSTSTAASRASPA